jgi:catalase (peroxidase I)
MHVDDVAAMSNIRRSLCMGFKTFGYAGGRVDDWVAAGAHTRSIFGST